MRHAVSVAVAAMMTILSVHQARAGEVRDVGSLDRQPFIGLAIAGLYGGRVSVDPIADGPAAAAGVDYGDIVLSLNGQGVTSAEQFYEKLERLRVGQKLELELSREGQRHKIGFDLEPLPWEQAPPGVDLVYDSIDVGDGTVLRTITAMPADADAPLPGVLYLQPMACVSIEETVGEPSPRLRFVYDLASQGFAVMRIERSGLGDSSGPPCADLDFETEVAHARAALEKLRGYEEVASDRLFVFGHDMGAAAAPLVADDGGLGGVVVYGAPFRPYIEQQVDSGRRQARLRIRFDPASSITYEGIEEAMRGLSRMYHHLLIDKMTVDELKESNADLALFAQAVFPDGVHAGTRHIDYFRQLNDTRLAAAWSDVDAPVLVLRGEYDWVASALDAELIVDCVNSVREGHAALLDLGGCGHVFERYPSLEATLDQWARAEYDASIAPGVARWMRERLQGDAGGNDDDPE